MIAVFFIFFSYPSLHNSFSQYPFRNAARYRQDEKRPDLCVEHKISVDRNCFLIFARSKRGSQDADSRKFENF